MKFAKQQATRVLHEFAVIAVCLGALCWCSDGLCQESPTDAPPIIVATKEAPPFSMKGDEGGWSGVSIDLWKAIATDLDRDYRFREMELAEILEAMRAGTCDAAVAALTLTDEREKAMDFTHPFYTSGLGIAVAVDEPPNSRSAVLRAMASREFLEILGGLLCVLLAVGLLIWLFERRKNRLHFGGSVAKGLGSGFWWSAVTMTTVGYGDKAPITLPGRLLAIIWMFTSLFMISFFTASVASLVLVDRLESRVTGLKDLPQVRVATMPGSTSESYLRRQRIRIHPPRQPYASLTEVLQALHNGQVDAVVYDAPILRYTIHKDFRDTLAVLPIRFETQNYGIGLPTGSPLRESVNQSLLRITNQPDWQDILYRYLGE